ncbi:MAG: rhodanese-like domain-containing protein [Chlorobiaceae bacterium]|nr:rhodanese-like domain-containing protein [Chlorobiaceae bacterium]NTW74041.1 rhodanese-like domain-containing protein [Chlorobiaceae bacterium]
MSKLKEVTPTEALAMTRKGVTLVDVRESHEVARKSFETSGLLHIPLSKIETRIQEIPQGKPVIVACHRGNRSQMAARMLANHGYHKVINMQGGMVRWEKEGLPVRTPQQVNLLSRILKLFGKRS